VYFDERVLLGQQIGKIGFNGKFRKPEKEKNSDEENNYQKNDTVLDNKLSKISQSNPLI
jgi:hypothetical protein